MLAVKQRISALFPLFWRPPIVVIGATHLLIPLLLLWGAPAMAQVPGAWIGASLFVAQLLCLSYTSSKMALRLSPFRGTETVLVALTIFMCFPAVIVPYLGLMGRLSMTSLLMASGTLQIVLLMATQKYDAASLRGRQTLPNSLCFSERFLISLSILAFGIMALNSVRYTARDSDTLWFHLPLVAEWIKNHSIAPVASIGIGRAYPGARETILTWLSFPLTSENLALFFLVEVPAIFSAIYAICREFNVSQTAALSAASLFLSSPEISMWAATQKNDLFLAVTFLLVLFFMVRSLRTGSIRYSVFAGLAGGLLCAAKFSGPIYAGVLGVMFVGALVLRNKETSACRQPANDTEAAILMSLLAVVIAAPWYVRNVIYFANPFYPKRLALFGKTVFAGPLDEQVFAPVSLRFDFVRLFSYWKRFVEGFGVALPFLVVTPLLVLVLYIRRNGRRKERHILLWLVILPVLLLLLYMQQPFSVQPVGINSWEVQPRYLFSFAACLHISLGFLLSADPRYLRFGLPLVVSGVLVNLAWWTHFWWLVAALAVPLVNLIRFAPRLPYILTANRIRSRRALAATGVLALVGSVAACHWMDEFRERHKEDPEYGYNWPPGWSRVCTYVRQHMTNKRLLCLGRPEKFPLYGRGYTNTLYGPPDKEGILQLINEQHVEYVIGFRPIDDRLGAKGEVWVFGTAPTKSLRERYPKKFQLVYTYDGAEVLKVLQ